MLSRSWRRLRRLCVRAAAGLPTGWLAPALAAATGLALASGCGLLGKKGDIDKLLEFNKDKMGCLNDIGPRFEAYYQGEIDEDKWQATWDCAIDSLDLFKKFVKAGSDQGYTQEDIHEFVSRFLLTTSPVTPELIAASFELKASLFGGTRDAISPGELERVIELLRVAKRETTALIPQMKARVREPTADNLLALIDGLGTAADHLASTLDTRGNPMFTWASAETFSAELAKILNWDMPPGATAWVSALKVLFMAGSRDGIEADAWPRLVRTAVAYGGPALAAFSTDPKFMPGPNAMGQFYMKLAWRLRSSLLQTIELYGGAIPLTSLDQVIDALPARWMPIEPEAIKKTLRPVANRVLGSQVKGAIDKNAVDLVFAQADAWTRGQTQLEKIYQLLDADSTGVTPERFDDVATDYAETLDPDQRPDVYRLIMLAHHFRPLFLSGDNQITFVPQTSHSLQSLSRWLWMRIAVETVMRAYSSSPDRSRATVADLRVLIADFLPLGFAVHIMDPTVPDTDQKRFREANLFTYASDGNNYLDLDEATYYLAFLYSEGMLSARTLDGMARACPALGKDILGYQWSSVDCFRKEYFGNYRQYWDHFPELVRYYSGLSDSKRLQLQQAMEQAGRRYGYTGENFARDDSDGMSGIVHYVEAMFTRYDTDGNQEINLDELMGAYPAFKSSLAQLGGIDPSQEFLLKSAFTYTVKFGHVPTKDVLGLLDFAAWMAWEPFWTIQADRLALFKVIGNISVPEPVPSPGQ